MLFIESHRACSNDTPRYAVSNRPVSRKCSRTLRENNTPPRIAVHNPCPNGARNPRNNSVVTRSINDNPFSVNVAVSAYPADSNAANPNPTLAPSTSPSRQDLCARCRVSNASAASFTASSINPTPTNNHGDGCSRYVSSNDAPSTPSTPPTANARNTISPEIGTAD